MAVLDAGESAEPEGLFDGPPGALRREVQEGS